MYYFKEDKKEEIVVEEKLEKKVKIEEKEETILVDIKGEVANPGIYSMKESERVIDVIEKAGGLTENADTSAINLSKKLVDEMVIIIYSREQIANFIETKKQEELIQNKCHTPNDSGLVNDACISNDVITSGQVNINTATKEVLMTLPGIGEAKANDIITYRETNGPFNTIEEIMNVTGIGESIYAQIKENITTG